VPQALIRRSATPGGCRLGHDSRPRHYVGANATRALLRQPRISFRHARDALAFVGEVRDRARGEERLVAGAPVGRRDRPRLPSGYNVQAHSGGQQHPPAAGGCQLNGAPARHREPHHHLPRRQGASCEKS